MEVYHKENKGFIEVWLTNEEQETCNRKELTEMLLSNLPPKKRKKCKVVFFLSGEGDLFQCAENLLINNLGCA